MATHSSVLAWRIPGTMEPGGLPSMGSHRVGHDWSNLAYGILYGKAVILYGKRPSTDEAMSSYCKQNCIGKNLPCVSPEIIVTKWSEKSVKVLQGGTQCPVSPLNLQGDISLSIQGKPCKIFSDTGAVISTWNPTTVTQPHWGMNFENTFKQSTELLEYSVVGVPNNPGTPHVPAITINLGSLTKQPVFHLSDHTHLLTHMQWFTVQTNCQTKHAPSAFLEAREGLLFITTAELIWTMTCQYQYI